MSSTRTSTATWRLAVIHGNAIYRQKLGDAVTVEGCIEVVARVSSLGQLHARVLSGEINALLIDENKTAATPQDALTLKSLPDSAHIIALARRPEASNAASDPRVCVVQHPNPPIEDDAIEQVRQFVTERLGVRDETRQRRTPTAPRIVAIGSSTGGPEALTAVFRQLSQSTPVPIVIAQHMPAGFTRGLAEQLQSVTSLKVCEARHDTIAEAGNVYIAPGGKHLGVTLGSGDTIRLELSNKPPINSARPSVDYLFDSIAAAMDGRALGVVLTGMGDDGARAAKRLRDSGAKIFVQDEASCTIYGMPKATVEAGAASAVMPLDQVAANISEELRWVGR